MESFHPRGTLKALWAPGALGAPARAVAHEVVRPHGVFPQARVAELGLAHGADNLVAAVARKVRYGDPARGTRLAAPLDCLPRQQFFFFDATAVLASLRGFARRTERGRVDVVSSFSIPLASAAAVLLTTRHAQAEAQPDRSSVPPRRGKEPDDVGVPPRRGQELDDVCVPPRCRRVDVGAISRGGMFRFRRRRRPPLFRPDHGSAANATVSWISNGLQWPFRATVVLGDEISELSKRKAHFSPKVFARALEQRGGDLVRGLFAEFQTFLLSSRAEIRFLDAIEEDAE